MGASQSLRKRKNSIQSSAGFQPAVSQGFQPAEAGLDYGRFEKSSSPCRLEIGDTAGWKPALLGNAQKLRCAQTPLTRRQCHASVARGINCMTVEQAEAILVKTGATVALQHRF